MPADWFNDWKQAYDQDPWGDERNDWRAMALEIVRGDPDTDARLLYPYWEQEEDLEERLAALGKRRAEVTPELAARLKADKEAYLKAKNRV